MHQLNDGPQFPTKRTLAKWAKITMTDAEIKEGVTYSDGKLSLYLSDPELLFSFLETDDVTN